MFVLATLVLVDDHYRARHRLACRSVPARRDFTNIAQMSSPVRVSVGHNERSAPSAASPRVRGSMGASLTYESESEGVGWARCRAECLISDRESGSWGPDAATGSRHRSTLVGNDRIGQRIAGCSCRSVDEMTARLASHRIHPTHSRPNDHTSLRYQRWRRWMKAEMVLSPIRYAPKVLTMPAHHVRCRPMQGPAFQCAFWAAPSKMTCTPSNHGRAP